jgi:CubicO group peptidase (beta-lactamase class C family)
MLITIAFIPVVGSNNELKNKTTSQIQLSGVEWVKTYGGPEKEKGDYYTRVKVKDDISSESDWSDPLAISLPKNRILGNQESLGIFDRLITFLMKIGRFPSLSACIIDANEIVWSNGYGFYDLENEKTATTDTVYNIASISKTITSTALMQLYEQGLFDLDDDVNDYLPFSLRNPNFPDVPITFRMLLSHQSSLAEDPQEFYQFSYWFGGDSPVPLYPFLETYLVLGGSNYTSDVWSNDAPGENFHYANIGFALIGYLVEQITGKTFDQYCKDNIFLPLEMYNTSYRLLDINLGNLAVPYDYINGNYIKYDHYGYIDYPSGSVRTSIPELSHFLIAHMNGGRYKNVHILDENTVDLMHTIQYSGGNYGLGWVIGSSPNGNRFIGHEGGDIGVVTSMYIRESDNIAVIIFVNVSPWTMNIPIWYLMQDILFLKAKFILN